jgi:hypothetical protein
MTLHLRQATSSCLQREDLPQHLQCCYNLDMTRHNRPRVYVVKQDASRGILARFGPMWGPSWQGYLVLVLTIDLELQLCNSQCLTAAHWYESTCC